LRSAPGAEHPYRAVGSTGHTSDLPHWRAIAAALVAFALILALLSAAGGIAGWEFVALTIIMLVVVAVRVRRDSARVADRAGP
jgi:hypothetical membrane protein